MEKDKPTIYELCVELKKGGLKQERRDDAFYFIRPDILVRLEDIDALHQADKSRNWEDLFEKLTYYPIEGDLFANLGTDLQQIQRMADYTFFAYCEADYLGDEAYRARGDTVWEALTNVIIVRVEARKAKLLENKLNQDGTTKED